jgi:cephalosporin hydroxylase
MSLVELIDNERTDKNTRHSYIPAYENILNKIKYTAKNVLEIGICYGGSIRLWHDYFPNATVRGADILGLESSYENTINVSEKWHDIIDQDRIILHLETDAYDQSFYENTVGNIQFDFILDDGPHSLESMLIFVEKYSPLLSDNGILILEDIPTMDWVGPITEKIPENLRQNYKIHDLRHIKGRFDDIFLVIDKNMTV